MRCLALAVAALLILSPFSPAAADGTVHRLALQISDDDPQKMNTVLNVAANVTRHYQALGEEVEISVVAFNKGLHMLRADTSPPKIRDRLAGFAGGMPNVVFNACNNTYRAMSKRAGKDVPLVENAIMVSSGAVRLIELDEQGWTVIRP